eukprot:CAMPEP_0194748976 /NCGR_PEP_ID=MMETSP0323_2-20130528/3167_1 /TAXON_ID=2866 ORGANISM="Crypthecodinium cohnii, Strain Seligo" /NCGR_SAMPLE_ID=MMETSP0323_2 /ASSEMBLY_ACC=CAM_ASM_000346 /LENGTH=90 /DNA_ID=CAMNT_0039663705 /DNA_START=123 /DNA_END=395 /DNA_ORIENTATION=-
MAASGRSWPPSTAVDRLLDDVSDIWAAAVVVARKPHGRYDIQYTDATGNIERDVEFSELRLRCLDAVEPSSLESKEADEPGRNASVASSE